MEISSALYVAAFYITTASVNYQCVFVVCFYVKCTAR